MNKLLTCLAVLCIAYPLSGRAAIHKCVEENAVVYRDTPCDGAQAATNLAVAPSSMELNSPRPPEFRLEPLPPSQLQSTALAQFTNGRLVANL